MAFQVKPYTAIEDQDFPQEVLWNIEAYDVLNLQPVEGTMLFPFINCRFKKLTIKNTEEIVFTDISIYFNNCFIEEIWVEEIITKNVSINFESSIVSGQIKNTNISSVGFNNCIIAGNFFLMEIPHIYISYTEENIFVRRWLKLIKSLNTTYTGLLEQAQKLYIYRPQVFTFKMNENRRDRKGFYVDEYGNSPELKYCFNQNEREKLDIHLYFNFEKSEKKVQIEV